jgi:hypothetical protein
VLVASGDMSLGLREQRNGTLYYESLPKGDQRYADQLPGAVEPPGHPLAGLDQLAAMVRRSGITRVNGNVVIDDRLFAGASGISCGVCYARVTYSPVITAGGERGPPMRRPLMLVLATSAVLAAGAGLAAAPALASPMAAADTTVTVTGPGNTISLTLGAGTLGS